MCKRKYFQNIYCIYIYIYINLFIYLFYHKFFIISLALSLLSPLSLSLSIYIYNFIKCLNGLSLPKYYNRILYLKSTQQCIIATILHIAFLK